MSLQFSKNSFDGFVIFHVLRIFSLRKLNFLWLLCYVLFCADPAVSTRSARGGKSERISSKIARDASRVEVGNDARTLSPTLMKDISCEDDKGRIMEEVMKTYMKQQEKLNTILRRKQQLQMVQCQSECISLLSSENWLVLESIAQITFIYKHQNTQIIHPPAWIQTPNF